MKTIRIVVLSFVAVGMLAGGVLGADSAPANAAVKAAPEASKAEATRLEGMIKEMGINFEKKSDEKTGVVYFLVKEYGAENYFFEIEESKNKNYTWVTFPCTKAPETGIPAEVMEKMLTENTKMSTAFFQYYPKTRMIVLKMPIASSTLSAKELKQQINWLMKDASRTRPLWDSTAWGKAEAGK